MTTTDCRIDPGEGGILIHGDSAADVGAARARVTEWLDKLGFGDRVLATAGTTAAGCGFVRLRLREDAAREWLPGDDTLGLCEKLALDTVGRRDDLEREILLAMLGGPVAFEYPSFEELGAAVRIRQNIVEAARRTALAFDTAGIERPEDCWRYAKGRGFTILPGTSLIEALVKATQPDASGRLYAFSCYRATEYVILLGIAQELAHCNPELLERLQAQWETRAIMSGQFHEVFLREYGSMEQPLPPKYYVPGDRLWFRNPDERSSDVTGYEGSWVFYHGGGLFSNFWKRNRPYTMASKCVEIFHWRHGAYVDAAGELKIDEAVVEERVAASMADPAEVDRILGLMVRLRDPKGVYAVGGCIDTSREYPRWVCPGTSDMVLPAD